MHQGREDNSTDHPERWHFPRWAWTSAGAAIGLIDFCVILAFDANLVIAGRDATLPMFFFFLIPYGLLGWAIGGLAEARHRAERDRRTIAKQLAQLERTQRALVQEEKLAGIGRLAAGVAHEVRNPLGVIRASASMAQESFDRDSDPHRALGFICEETDRLDRLIQSLLTFAKPQPIECVATDLPKVVDRAVELARHEAEERGIQLQVDLEPGLPSLYADPDRLSQALYGLTLNAIQSIEDDEAASTQEPSAASEQEPSAASKKEPSSDSALRKPRVLLRARCEDEVLRLEVADSGPGVPVGLRDQIFEPFVSTKDRGTGLGLPMALRMIEAQGGALTLTESDALPGACFRIEFPMTRALAGGLV